MPLVPFDSLPDDARVWVFGSDEALAPSHADRLLGVVDAYLATWAAHGAPLHSARDWRESRFLTIAVDQRQAGASGCSIDGLFRSLRSLESEIGTSLVAGGRVFYRDGTGSTVSLARSDFSKLGASGNVGQGTRVFDLTVTTLGEWRERFETPASESWHAALL